jgi:hypothetical protein
VYDGTSWIHYCLDQDLQPGQVVNSFAFRENSVYIATDGAGIGQFNGQTWGFYTLTDGLYSNSIFDLEANTDGLWAATYNGVARLTGSRWTVAYTSKKDGLINNAIHAFLQDKNGDAWFGTISHGISHLRKNGTWESFYTDDVFHRDIRRISEDDEGGIWFATDKGGVLKYYKGVWTNYSATSGALPSDEVHDVEKDKYGRIWVATEGGLVYTPDLGKTWILHSSWPIMDIEFGCSGCKYEDNHMWLAVKDRGLGHVRIPPLGPTLSIVSVPKNVQLKPGQEFIFEVKVKVLAEQLSQEDGDSLRSLTPDLSQLYGASPIIPSLGVVTPGDTYTFSNVDHPIIAPPNPGSYQIVWRIWQGRRFVTEPIVIQFEVVN